MIVSPRKIIQRNAPAAFPSKQSGTILVVALVMLLIVTVIGISTIGSTSLEVQMAANAQFKNIVFQESEHAIEETVDNIPLLSSAYTASLASTDPSWPTVSITEPSSNNLYVSSQSEVQFIGFANPAGENAGSIRLGASGYSLYNYEIRGSAAINNSGASNTNVRGAYIIGAKPN